MSDHEQEAAMAAQAEGEAAMAAQADADRAAYEEACQREADIEALKAQHTNQALQFVHDALSKRPRTEEEAHRRAEVRHAALDTAQREWQAIGGTVFVLAVMRSTTRSQLSEALHDAMRASFLAGALAAEELRPV